nr:exonuclease domain-containing protein [Corynebacterium hansenii]
MLGGGRRKATGALAEFYAAPTRDDRWLAVDVETTGLDPNKDRLLSIGWVPVDGDEIILGGAGHVILRGAEGEASVGASATLHGLTDDDVAAGVEPREAMEMVLRALAGRKLLAHFAKLETGFLDRACRKHFGAGLKVDVADTMQREYLKYQAADREPRRDELRLWTCRERYGLPPYKAHHALTDALAGAELWLAQNAAGLPR